MRRFLTLAAGFVIGVAVDAACRRAFQPAEDLPADAYGPYPDSETQAIAERVYCPECGSAQVVLVPTLREFLWCRECRASFVPGKDS